MIDNSSVRFREVLSTTGTLWRCSRRSKREIRLRNPRATRWSTIESGGVQCSLQLERPSMPSCRRKCNDHLPLSQHTCKTTRCFLGWKFQTSFILRNPRNSFGSFEVTSRPKPENHTKPLPCYPLVSPGRTGAPSRLCWRSACSCCSVCSSALRRSCRLSTAGKMLRGSE